MCIEAAGRSHGSSFAGLARAILLLSKSTMYFLSMRNKRLETESFDLKKEIEIAKVLYCKVT
jgi:hypothetical protein